jgi:hypothetical protein
MGSTMAITDPNASSQQQDEHGGQDPESLAGPELRFLHLLHRRAARLHGEARPGGPLGPGDDPPDRGVTDRVAAAAEPDQPVRDVPVRADLPGAARGERADHRRHPAFSASSSAIRARSDDSSAGGTGQASGTTQHDQRIRLTIKPARPAVPRCSPAARPQAPGALPSNRGYALSRRAGGRGRQPAQ